MATPEGWAQTMAAKVGDRIDRFTLVRQLGAGGMGATWEAVRQASHDFEQRVAIKLADPELLNTTEGLASFRREAALAASLRHPNIAAVLDVDEAQGYIVCELVDGSDLRSVLRAAPGNHLDAPQAVHLLSQIARGLSHAHRRILRGRPSPVIHRDMSPGNVVVDYDGNVKIVDFGIAQVLVAGIDPAESLKGKLSYMAPEQAMGARMDGRVDQYAVGVIAYEVLSGVRPNDGAHEGETLACLLGGKRVPLGQRMPKLPADLVNVIERMLALRPEQRFANMDAVLDALAQFTPPLTTYRALGPLVIAARQPHTIVRENGQFVSRPVEAQALLSDAVCAAMSLDAVRAQGLSTPPALPRRELREAPAAYGFATHADTHGSLSEQRSLPAERAAVVQAFAATLGSTHPAQQSSSLRAVAARTPTAPVIAPQLRISSSSNPRRRVRKPSLFLRVLSSRALWQGLTIFGAVLLGFVIWVAFSPNTLSLLLPDSVERVPYGVRPQSELPLLQPQPSAAVVTPAASVRAPAAEAEGLAATAAHGGAGTPAPTVTPTPAPAP